MTPLPGVAFCLSKGVQMREDAVAEGLAVHDHAAVVHELLGAELAEQRVEERGRAGQIVGPESRVSHHVVLSWFVSRARRRAREPL